MGNYTPPTWREALTDISEIWSIDDNGYARTRTSKGWLVLNAVWLVPAVLCIIVYFDVIAPVYTRVTGRAAWGTK